MKPEQKPIATRKELCSIVRNITAHTLIAYRMYDALGIPRPTITARYGGHTRSRHTGKRKKYRGARKLMAQKHGVKL